MSEPRPLGLPEVRRLVGDDQVAKGSLLVDGGKLLHLSRHGPKLFCEAKGSTAYRVSATFDDQGRVTTRCSCPAARFNAVCKHAAGLLVAWARAPESFVTTDAAPDDAGTSAGPRRSRTGGAPSRAGTVRRGTADTKQLRKQGVEQAATLTRELAVTGVAGIGGDRVAQMRDLAELLRSNRLRRPSARILELADLLGTEEPPDPVDYAELLTDLVLTVRKLEKHLEGEPLDKRHEEELVGRTWRKNDREPIAGLDLLEVTWRQWTTPDEFVVRESRFVDLASGTHFSEKQIVPGFRARFEPPKPSYARTVLRGASGGLFPGYPPRRLYLDDTGIHVDVTPAHVEALLNHAVRDLKAAMEAYQAHRRDVFAPDGFPVLLATERIHAGAGRLRVLDGSGATLAVAADRGLQLALTETLRGRTLRALIGDIALEGVVPELQPLAVVADGADGPELHPLAAVAVRSAAPRRPWQEEARAAGLSNVAVSLGEVRRELAMVLTSGLRGLVPRVVDPLAARLTELGLARAVPLLQGAVAEADPAARLDPFVKVYALLGIALVRLAGAVPLTGETAEVPGLPSVRVTVPERDLPPAEAARLATLGAAGRCEAELHYGRWYAQHPLDEVYPHWADALARPHVVAAMAERPDVAVPVARRVLESDRGKAACRTACAVLAAIGAPEAGVPLARYAKEENDPSLSAWILSLFGRRDRPPMQLRARTLPPGGVELLSDEIRGAGRAEMRTDAIRRAMLCGALECLPALRHAFHADPTATVRREAMLALAELGDPEVVGDLVQVLECRGTVDAREVNAAARALGTMGDARGVEALLRAFDEGYSPGVISEALQLAGNVVVVPLLERVVRSPELLGRAAVKTVLGSCDGAMVGYHAARIVASLDPADDLPAQVGKWLKLAGGNKEALPLVAAGVVRLAERLEGKVASAVRRKVPAAVARAPDDPESVVWWSGLTAGRAAAAAW